MTPSALMALGAGAAGAIAIGFTRPFTWQADLITALGIAGLVTTGGVAMLHGRSRRSPASARAGVTRRPAVVWIAAAAVLVALELVSLLSQPRRTHPTVSSYLAVVSAHQVGKSLLFAVWLAAGWWIWRTGPGPERERRHDG